MSSPIRVSVLSCAATAVVLAGVAAGGFGAGETIERSYGQVFGALDEAQSTRGSRAGRSIDPALIHLSGLPAGPMAPVVNVGDVITLAARGGGSVAYEVIEVRPLPRDSGVEPTAGLPRLMMVTAIATSQPVTRTIRFIVDADNPGDTLPLLEPRAL